MPYSDPVKQKQAQHESYLRNKEKILFQSRENKRKLKEEIRKLKDVPCADCGKRYGYWVMHFDHINPSNKEECIAILVKGNFRKKAFMEVEKCEIVCANCHADRTHERLLLSDEIR